MKAALRTISFFCSALFATLWQASVSATAAEFVETPCWFINGGDQPAACGKLVVPVRHEAPEGPSMALSVVVLTRPAPGKAREPIVILSGGPGGPTYIGTVDEIEDWRRWATNLPGGHDLILLDLRGAGLSEPSLRCPEIADPLVWAPASLRPGEQRDPLPSLLQAAARCRDRLLASGHDLGAYNSEQTAQDVVALRQALKIERWTLFGYSYGTSLALRVLRRDEAGVRSLILDGVVPPHHDDSSRIAAFFDRALKRVFDDCAAAPVCAAAYPALERRLDRLLERLATAPVEIAVPDLQKSTEIYVQVDAVQFLSILIWALYDPGAISKIPKLIESTAKGDYITLNRFAWHYYLSPYWQEESYGVSQSFFCHEEFPFEDKANVRKQAARFPYLAAWLIQFQDEDFCKIWPAGRADPSVKDPVSSAVPALLLAGAYDPRTPLPLAEMAAEHLPNGHVFEFPSGSHSVTVRSGCPFQVIAAFLAEPFTRPQPPCLNRESPASFEISSQ